MRRTYQLITIALAAAACGACGASDLRGPRLPPASPAREDPGVLAADLAKTRPVGPGIAYRPPPVGNPQVQSGAPVGSLHCRPRSAVVYGAHVELFARNRGVQVPAGIGISEGRHRGSFVADGRCRYELSTTDPTGVVAVQPDRAGSVPKLGQLFALWGQPLYRMRLASFAGKVTAFLNGRRWSGDPRGIPLRRHAQIVLELGPLVQPHPSYLFPRGL